MQGNVKEWDNKIRKKNGSEYAVTTWELAPYVNVLIGLKGRFYKSAKSQHHNSNVYYYESCKYLVDKAAEVYSRFRQTCPETCRLRGFTFTLGANYGSVFVVFVPGHRPGTKTEP